MKTIDILALVLLVVGGLNWGLVALFNFDLVAAITGAGGFGNKNMLGVIVYTLVALSAVYLAVTMKSLQRAR
ncbi:MAG TPA: DUF378 domain-containing protein [Longimicrobiales bacterium]